jgi:galactokinase
MSSGESVRKATRIAQLVNDVMAMRGEAATGSERPVSFWVPGRIEVLGKHTDYGGGRSLLCAVERGICVAALPSADREPDSQRVPRVRIRDANSGEMAEIELSPDVSPTPGHWSN